MLINIRDTDDYTNSINNHSRLVIFFGSNTCPHCVSVTPYISTLSNKYPNVTFAKADVKDFIIANLTGIPTFVVYKNGKEIDTLVGDDRDKLNGIVSKLL